MLTIPDESLAGGARLAQVSTLSQGVLEKNSRRVESYNKDAPSHIAMLKRRMVVASLIAPARLLIIRVS